MKTGTWTLKSARPQVIPFRRPLRTHGYRPMAESKKHQKSHPICSARPVLCKRFPPSVVAVLRDLRVCLAMLDTENHANHDGQRAQTGAAFWAKRAWRCREVRFLRFVLAPGHRTASVVALWVGGMGGAGMTWGRALCNLHVPFFLFQTS